MKRDSQQNFFTLVLEKEPCPSMSMNDPTISLIKTLALYLNESPVLNKLTD